MEAFIHNVLKTKKVSVWGIGYLGYTTLLRLQSRGFVALVHDFNDVRVASLMEKSYPFKVQQETWSRNGKLPEIDVSKVVAAKELSEMFESSVHIISFPFLSNMSKENIKKLISVFKKNKEKLEHSLIIFQSNETPRAINYLIEKLGFDINVASAFRNDWNIEDFLSNQDLRPISGNNARSIENAAAFFDLFDINYMILDSIEEAEVYENVQNSIQSLLSAFFNQLSLANPHMDIKKISDLLIKHINLSGADTGLNSINYKITNSVQNLINGSLKPDFLSLISETQNSNIALILYYADLLKNRNVRSVTIYGISTQISLKDIKLSPSIALAEYLHKIGMDVYVNDPNFTQEEIGHILPFAKIISITDEVLSDAVFVMNPSMEYKFLNQADLDRNKISRAKIVIDSVGQFKDFIFSPTTIYHQIGDSNLMQLER